VLQVISVLHTLSGERGILRYLGALQVYIIMALMQILAAFAAFLSMNYAAAELLGILHRLLAEHLMAGSVLIMQHAGRGPCSRRT